MSRSYKHSPVWTDGSCGSTKNTKQKANRIVRRRNRRIVKGYLMRDPRFRDEMTLDGKSYKKYFCSWDIHDWINYWSKADAIHQYEHPHWHYSPWKDEWWHIWDEYATTEEFLNKHWKKIFYRK